MHLFNHLRVYTHANSSEVYLCMFVKVTILPLDSTGHGPYMPHLACATLICSILHVASYPTGSIAEAWLKIMKKTQSELLNKSCSDCVFFIIFP